MLGCRICQIFYFTRIMWNITRIYVFLIISGRIGGTPNLFPLLKELQNPERLGIYRLGSRDISEIEEHAFQNFTNVKSVQLDNNRIRKISPSAFTGTAIAGLHLSMNRLKCIPDLRSIINTLTVLSINHNKLGECQMSSQHCSGTYRISYLDIGFNALTQLPRIVFCTSHLKSLLLRANKFQTLPDLFSMGILPSYSNYGRLHIDDNPFSCGCNIVWIMEWEEGCKAATAAPFCMLKRFSRPPFCKSGPFQRRLWRNLTVNKLVIYCNSTTTG